MTENLRYFVGLLGRKDDELLNLYKSIGETYEFDEFIDDENNGMFNSSDVSFYDKGIIFIFEHNILVSIRFYYVELDDCKPCKLNLIDKIDQNSTINDVLNLFGEPFVRSTDKDYLWVRYKFDKFDTHFGVHFGFNVTSKTLQTITIDTDHIKFPNIQMTKELEYFVGFLGINIAEALTKFAFEEPHLYEHCVDEQEECHHKYYTFQKSGFEFLSLDESTMHAIFFYMKKANETLPFKFELISGITADSTLNDVLALLGEPLKRSKKEASALWVKYAYDKFNKCFELDFEFDTATQKLTTITLVLSTPKDELVLVHIPSVVALLEAEKLRLKRNFLTIQEKRDIVNKGTVIAITREMHQKFRTYGGRNTKEQDKQDAVDLSSAAFKDVKVLEQILKQEGKTQEQIQQTIDKLNEINAKRGIK